MTTPYHPPRKYSVRIDGHRTSVSLEPIFWDLLRSAAARRGVAVNTLVATIDAERIRSETPPGLAGAIRVWLASHEMVSRHEMSGGIAPAALSNGVAEEA
ncbi:MULTISPECIES: ribbon-helix-helix domain-containing protein [Qipengyuania]|uniref:Ribbon-helix-helix domain-containing protein n=1 Tax=Qipengyuania gelatinilytica TaxID=2867231 RepID=A0ABX9A0Y7_9SPHN|nr:MULTISPECIES: ribbon-helix-helix domain-containing protein [Qipengyuania]MBX7532829.1 ribbon-helix-helix domain-containing protein [Qipengyuania xiamenensis]QZD93994.1 ribbon-helix-helix domain-containing protein [Qipengyuania gelatinilytica]